MSATPTTCTVQFATGLCGKPAVVTFTGRDGTVYAECIDHAPAVQAQVHTYLDAHLVAHTTPGAPLRTRSKAPYALVAGYRIVGYAHSGSPAVLARARRLGAKLVPIKDGLVQP